MRRSIFNDRTKRTYSCDYTKLGKRGDKEQRTLNEVNNMELEVKETKRIADGSHEGVIQAVEYRSKPLEYTDYVIKSEEVTIKASYPTNITPDTIHGKMLSRFGLQIEAHLKVDPDKLIGVKCRFTTVNHTTPKGTFPEIMRNTLKPLMDEAIYPV